METEGSLPFSQKFSTGPYPEPNKYTPHPSCYSKVSFNIIFSSMPTSRKWSLLSRILYAFPNFLTRATCPAQLITLIWSHE
jgi:hypothetical protein